jgi:hypothetical protein
VAERGSEERLDRLSQKHGVHHHRIAAGDQHISDFVVFGQILHQCIGVAGGESQVFDTDELRPSKAVGAIGVTGLALDREEQHRLAILVLTPQDPLAVDSGHVEQLLTGRVRVHPHVDVMHQSLERLALYAPDNHVLEPQKIATVEHSGLRKGQLIDRIVGNVVPIDELAQNVFVDSEWENG